MFYITGDTHRDFKRVAALCDTVESTKDDVLIILGDAGINYFGGKKDRDLKRLLAELPITLFCIHGNHEQRPETLGYAETAWRGGIVYHEPEFQSLLFAKDGEVYDLGGRRCIVIGGAYSVDKPYRIAQRGPRRIEDSLGRGEATERASFSPQGGNERAQSATTRGWWSDEQPSPEIKQRIETQLDAEGWSMDIVLSHTCPLKYEPREMFIGGVSQSGVDKSTEMWLDVIEDRLLYNRWYCGHYHTDKTIDKLRFMFNDFLELR